MEREPAHKRNGIVDNNTRYVEEEMRQCDLHRVLYGRRVGRQSGEDSGETRADIGAQGEREHPLNADETHADERGQGGGEHRAALHQHRETGADQHSDVTSEEAGLAREVRVHPRPDGMRHGTFEDHVEYLDHYHYGGEEDGERAGKKDATNSFITQATRGAFHTIIIATACKQVGT